MRWIKNVAVMTWILLLLLSFLAITPNLPTHLALPTEPAPCAPYGYDYAVLHGESIVLPITSRATPALGLSWLNLRMFGCVLCILYMTAHMLCSQWVRRVKSVLCIVLSSIGLLTSQARHAPPCLS